MTSYQIFKELRIGTKFKFNHLRWVKTKPLTLRTKKGEELTVNAKCLDENNYHAHMDKNLKVKVFKDE